MSNRRFMMITIALFLLGALPFLVAQPTAAARAGLSLGFSAPLDHAELLVLLALGGVVSAFLPRGAVVLLPIAFTLMLLVGGILVLDTHALPSLRYFVLGATLCMALLIALAREKPVVLSLLVLASFGFHLGGFFMRAVPSIASPMYYMLGVLLSLGMMLAICVAFGVTVVGNNEAAWESLKRSPRVLRLRGLL